MSKQNRLRTQMLNRAAAGGASSGLQTSGTATSLTFTPSQGMLISTVC